MSSLAETRKEEKIYQHKYLLTLLGEAEQEKPKYPVASPRKRSAGSTTSGGSADQRRVISVPTNVQCAAKFLTTS